MDEVRRAEKAVVRTYARMYGVPKRVIVEAMLFERDRTEQTETPEGWTSDEVAMDDLVVDKESAPTWLDAFPWIQTAARLATDGDFGDQW
jgi:hypothetical protein